MLIPFLKNTTWPLPDWDEISKNEPESQKHEFWVEAGNAWMDTLAEALGDSYQITESKHFWLIAAQPAKMSIEQIKWLEGAMQKTLKMLGPLGNHSPLGKCPVLLFEYDEDYYDYISNYYEDGEWSTSGGIYLSQGYGHFAIPASSFHSLYTVLAHELTHALMGNCDIPDWLNEGLTQLCEEAIIGYLSFDADTIRKNIEHYWTESTIQGFWSGKGFKELGEGQALCYHLSQLLVYRLIQDRASFDKFAATAKREDAGEESLIKNYGVRLQDLIGSTLGEGNWHLQPESNNVSNIRSPVKTSDLHPN